MFFVGDSSRCMEHKLETFDRTTTVGPGRKTQKAGTEKIFRPTVRFFIKQLAITKISHHSDLPT